MRVRISEEARQFLRDEARYLRDRSPAAARRLLDRINEAKRNLADYPMMGSRAEHSPIPGARQLVVGDYILTYDVGDDGVSVAAIRHGRMAPPELEDDYDYEVGADHPKP